MNATYFLESFPGPAITIDTDDENGDGDQYENEDEDRKTTMATATSTTTKTKTPTRMNTISFVEDGWLITASSASVVVHRLNAPGGRVRWCGGQWCKRR